MRIALEVVIHPVVGSLYRMLGTDEAFRVNEVDPHGGLISVTSQSTFIPTQLSLFQFYRWFGDASGF